MVLLLYCIRLPRAASVETQRDGPSGGGPRSPVDLEAPVVPQRRSLVLHATNVWMWVERGSWMREAGRRGGALGRHTPRLPRGTALSEAGFEVEPTVEANGDKPISPLSVPAEPHCVSVVDCCWGGGQ